MSSNPFGKRGLSSDHSGKAKRICANQTAGRDKCQNEKTDNSTGEKTKSQCINWSDEDETFLLIAEEKLEDIFSGQDVVMSAPFTSPIGQEAQHSNSDDTLFADTLQSGVDDPTPKSGTATIGINEESFKNIDLNDFGTFEKEDIFQTNEFGKLDVQNTQLFIDTIAQLPKSPVSKQTKEDSLSLSLGTSFLSKSVLEGIIQGSQYDTYETLNNRTNPQIQLEQSTFLNNLDWQTQSLDDFCSGYRVPAKGDFFGLPDTVKKLIFEHKGIQNLYDWQNECLNLPAIRHRKNLIYALPTSGGKTLVAEILILRELICWQRNVLFILPYVSIVQEKVSAMSPFAIDLDFIVEEYTAGKGKCPPQQLSKRQRLYIASIEKGAVLMDSLIDIERPHEIGLVVVDELHLIGERGRGATLEALLTKIMFLKANIQIVGMSATIGNLNEISAFLNADVYTRGFRPVELKEYIKCGKDLLEINAAGKTVEEIFVPFRSVNYNYSRAVEHADPDHLGGLVNECAPEHCCLVFCPTRKNCENVALLLSRIVPKERFLMHRKTEKTDLMNALDKMCGYLSPVLARTLPYGIAYHHSGLTTEERKYIETAYRFGVITVICCTSTLAAGVNLPAKRVIIRAPYVGQEFMTLCKYKQMVGRAGRAGLGEAGESILITQSRDNLQVGEMLFSPMDKALSSLNQLDAIGLQSLIMSVIGLRLADCRRDLNRLIYSTLLSVQAGDLGIGMDELVVRVLRDMFKHKVLRLVESVPKENSDISHIYTTQDINSSNRPVPSDRRLFISQSTRFQLTSIGYAAFKAGIDYNRAFALHNELKRAQQQLILSSYVHLLYLVVCFNSNERGDEMFPADASILFREYTSLSADTSLLCKQLGFTEAHAARLAKTQSVQGPLALKLNRLYKVLILAEVLALVPLPTIATKYNIERGTLQQLVSQTTAAAGAAVRLCEQIEEFWCFKPLFERIHHKIDRCGTLELEPLMELPAVKISTMKNRARQLYAAGFKTIEAVAKTSPMTLVKSVEFMPMRVATEIISAAKIILMKKLDHLEEVTEELKSCLRQVPDDSNTHIEPRR